MIKNILEPMMTHIRYIYIYIIVIRSGHSGSFSGLFGIPCSFQIFEDLVRIWITNLNRFGLNIWIDDNYFSSDRIRFQFFKYQNFE